ncbi:MAG: gliding motility lipoprotein GldD [Bacteroidia bacterium]
MISLRSFILIFISITISCSNKQQTPKPKAYPRLVFPERKSNYTVVKECHYGLNLPVYANLKPDPYPNPDECWYNVNFLPFKATLHLSYKPLKNRNDLFKMLDDANTMVFKHVMKADEIRENYIKLPGKYGIYYELDGSTATHNQFYITDSVRHFLRGSLYFNVRTEADSIAPVVEFLKQDVLQIIASIKWEE